MMGASGLRAMFEPEANANYRDSGMLQWPFDQAHGRPLSSRCLNSLSPR